MTRDTDRSGEAGETPLGGSTVGESRGRQASPDLVSDLERKLEIAREALEYARESLGDPVPIARRHVARRLDAAITAIRGCDSCGGLNTSCPEGCERDPKTGELIFAARKDTPQ